LKSIEPLGLSRATRVRENPFTEVNAPPRITCPFGCASTQCTGPSRPAPGLKLKIDAPAGQQLDQAMRRAG